MSTTLSSARAEVSKRAQEFLSGIATGGSTTTIVDTGNLQETDGYWAEAIALMTSGTNAGVSRRVQTFTASSSTLTMYAAFAGNVASGATYELYRRFSPNDIDTAINRSLNIAAPDFREKVRTVATTTANTLQYAFPTGPDLWDKGVVSIEYSFYDQATQSTFPFQKLSSDMYEVLEDFNGTDSIRTLQLKFNPQTNKLIRFVYDGPLGNVATGTDRIHLDLPELEWLYTQSVAELWRIESSRNTDVNRKASTEELASWEASADRLRRQLGQEQKPRPLTRTRFSVNF
jgi:hypothetical protein